MIVLLCAIIVPEPKELCLTFSPINSMKDTPIRSSYTVFIKLPIVVRRRGQPFCLVRLGDHASLFSMDNIFGFQAEGWRNNSGALPGSAKSYRGRPADPLNQRPRKMAPHTPPPSLRLLFAAFYSRIRFEMRDTDLLNFNAHSVILVQFL